MVQLEDFKTTYADELRFLKEKGRLVDEWANVYDHCFIEGLVAEVFSDMLVLDSQQKKVLIQSALLHDWYKRVEREAVAQSGFSQYNQKANESGKLLREFGYSDEIARLTESVGHSSLTQMLAHPTFLEEVMHYIDDITWGNRIVGIDERVDGNEAVDRYKELNESGRALFGGRTYFEIQREVGHVLEGELAARMHMQSQDIVPAIKRQLDSRFGVAV